MTRWHDLTPEQQHELERCLTPKELEAYRLALAGLGYRQIGLALNVSYETIRDRIKRAHRKLRKAGIT